MFRVVIAIALLLCQVDATPLIIRSGLGKQAGGVFATNTELRLANYEGDEGFNHQDKFYTNANDEGDFKQLDHATNKQNEASNFNKGEYGKVDEGSVSDAGNKVMHKKGHRKSGFHNTYHKDESGSKSSYVDDSVDEGDEYNRDSRNKIYGNNLQHNQEASHLDSNQNLSGNNRRGGYQQAGVREKYDGGRRSYINDDYRRDGFNKEVLRNEQQYHQPYRGYTHQNQRITIYEDPHYVRYNTRDRFRDIDRYYDYPHPVNVRNKYNERFHYPERSNYDYYF